jgi:hypothetical protein
MVVGGKCELYAWDPTRPPPFCVPPRTYPCAIRPRVRAFEAPVGMRVLAHARALQARACARLATLRAIIYLRARDIRVVVIARKGLTPIREWCNLSPSRQNNQRRLHT